MRGAPGADRKRQACAAARPGARAAGRHGGIPQQSFRHAARTWRCAARERGAPARSPSSTAAAARHPPSAHPPTCVVSHDLEGAHHEQKAHALLDGLVGDGGGRERGGHLAALESIVRLGHSLGRHAHVCDRSGKAGISLGGGARGDLFGAACARQSSAHHRNGTLQEGELKAQCTLLQNMCCRCAAPPWHKLQCRSAQIIAETCPGTGQSWCSCGRLAVPWC